MFLMCPGYLRAVIILDRLDELVRTRIEMVKGPPPLYTVYDRLYSHTSLPLFYERRGFQPAWIDRKGALPAAYDLVASLQDAYAEGLDPQSYHLASIKSLLNWQKNHKFQKIIEGDYGRLVDLELLLTDAFFTYGSHLLIGRVNPETIHSEWHSYRRGTDLTAALQQALRDSSVSATLEGFVPTQPEYRELKKALAQYRELQVLGGWPVLASGPTLCRGSADDERIGPLRKRLALTGDLGGRDKKGPYVFDEALEQAVARFQFRHGLDATGVVDTLTLAALNVSVSERIDQLLLNLERWRWLPQDLGRRYVLINVAAFRLDLVKDSVTVASMKIIVGKEYRRTPVFSDRISYLVFSPYWYVPRNIAVQDKLPIIKKNPALLAKENMKVFLGIGIDMREVPPGQIDWSKVTPANFNYQLRQEPGPGNALGGVKFMFPNKYNVYLHDTNKKELFGQQDRTLSSGCIRVEKPLELAEFLFKGDAKWTRSAIREAMDQGVEQTVRLPEPVPVHLLYWTAWAGPDGTVHFRRDIYARDPKLQDALTEKPLTYEK